MTKEIKDQEMIAETLDKVEKLFDHVISFSSRPIT